MPEQQTKWYKTWWGILLILFGLFIALLLAGFSLLVLHYMDVSEQPAVNYRLPEPTATDIDIQNNYWIGSLSPEIEIVEFADYACGYSRQAFRTIRRLSQERDDIKYIFKDYPVTAEISEDLAMAARCAGDQKLFWEMHDRLFLSPTPSSRDGIYALARAVGVDMPEFQTCLESGRFRAEVRADAAEAEKLGITGTPTWFINGRKLEGNAPYQTFNQILDNLKNNQS
jgi:protein-disulfide isomerase